MLLRCSKGKTESDDRGLVSLQEIDNLLSLIIRSRLIGFFWIRRAGFKMFWPVDLWDGLVYLQIRLSFKKDRKLIFPHRDLIICIVSLAIFRPHFVIGISPSAFYHPHFPILILSSAFFHPHFFIRIFPSAFYHPHFFYLPSAIRCHPVLTLQRPKMKFCQLHFRGRNTLHRVGEFYHSDYACGRQSQLGKNVILAGRNVLQAAGWNLIITRKPLALKIINNPYARQVLLHKAVGVFHKVS